MPPRIERKAEENEKENELLQPFYVSLPTHRWINVAKNHFYSPEIINLFSLFVGENEARLDHIFNTALNTIISSTV